MIAPWLGGEQALAQSLDEHWNAALIASIQKSTRTYASEISLWIRFCALARLSPIGRMIEDGSWTGASAKLLLRFSGLFSNGRTLEKYLTAVRFLHEVSDADTSSLDAKRLKRVVEGKKKNSRPPRRAVAIHCDSCRKIVQHAWGRHDLDFALQVVLAYTFGFRVLDELLPLEWDGLAAGGHSSISVYEGQDRRMFVRISLRSRKNEPHGAELVRPCVCRTDRSMCPVHTLLRWATLRNRTHVGRLFHGVPSSLYRSFMRQVQDVGLLLQIVGAAKWTSHGFRRGMAQDIIANGGSLADVLRAGGWRSAAFLLYLEKHEVDEAAALDCIFRYDVACSEDTLSALPRAVRALLAPLPTDFSLEVAGGQKSSQVPALRAPAPRARSESAPGPSVPAPAAASSVKRPRDFPDRDAPGPKKKGGQASLLSLMKFRPMRE